VIAPSYQATTTILISENTSSLNDSSQTIEQNHQSALSQEIKPEEKQPKPSAASQQKVISKKLQKEIA
jgi:hypothetical protein